MKTLFLSITLVLGLAFAYGQEYSSMDKSIMDAAYFPPNAPHRTFLKSDDEKMAAEPKIRVLYSRPMAKGREIFGGVVKYGEPWRLGANESTEILFMTDVVFGGKAIKAGRYTLIAVPTKDQWEIFLNSENDGWGNYSYKPEMNIASVTVPTKESSSPVEAFSISLYEKSENKVNMRMGWDKTYVDVPITLK